MYKYNAKLIKVVDGDTLDLEIDLGFGIKKIDRFRLYGIDTPETYGKNRSEKGKEATAYVKSKLENCSQIVVETYKDKQGKYGRYLANIIYNNVCLNEELVQAGLAKRYNV